MTMSAGPPRASLDDHVLRETFGWTAPLPPGTKLRIAKVVLAVAGADHEVTEAEATYALGLFRAMGLTPAEFEELSRYDHRVPLEPLVQPDLRPLARLILHEVVRVARADGFGERERRAALLAARALDVDLETVPAIEYVLGLDDAVRAARGTLLLGDGRSGNGGPKAHPDPSAPVRPDLAVAQVEGWYVRERYGVAAAVPRAAIPRVAKAVMVVAAADGELSEAELTWLLGMTRAQGATPEAVEELARFDYRAARLPDLLDPSMRPLARIVLYEAVNVARQDSFGDRERQAVVRAAKLMGLSPAVVPAVEGLLGVEDAVRAARIRVLSAP